MDWAEQQQPSVKEVKVRKRVQRRDAVDTVIPAKVGDRFKDELERLIGGLDQSEFKVKYLGEELLSKYVDPTTTPADVRQTAAIAKWLRQEVRNERTNQRIMFGNTDLHWIHVDDTYDYVSGHVTKEGLISQVRNLVARILGPLRYPAVLWTGVHTNGASVRVRKSPSAALFKLLGEVDISRSAAPHWEHMAKHTMLESQKLRYCESSVLFTVPKTSKIDRVACKEPEGNMLLQRSVGNHIRAQLKVWGIDLNDQSHNQELARTAVARKLATIDLSSASDSITHQLVYQLLPWEWYSLLDDLRVKSTVVGYNNYEVHNLEMFSSMGNGFTFELESLLFYAITRVVCRLSGVKGRISVYGDDIIAPVAIVPRLRRVFSWFGFKINPDKTHTSGYFRESCGAHYWRGVDVKPFYVRRAVHTLHDLILHLNHLLEWDGRGWGFFLTEDVYRFWKRWRNRVPRYLWGGISPEDNTALVTGDSPRKRLVPISEEGRRPAMAALCHWLCVRDRYGSDIPESVFGNGFEDDSFSLYGPRQDGDAHLVIDPCRVVAHRARPLVSRGERTSWIPGLLWDPDVRVSGREAEILSSGGERG